jgi:actin-like ATPase involved in cell morphogenesis
VEELERTGEDFEREVAVEELALSLTAEQQRYEESVRQIIETISEKFDRVSTEPGEGVEEKVRVLREGTELLRDLAGKLERLGAVAASAKRSVQARGDAERSAATEELVKALEELDRHVSSGGAGGSAPGPSSLR